MPNESALMFSVGIKDATQELEKIEQKLDKFIAKYNNGDAIKMRIEVANLTEVKNQLKDLGSMEGLARLRSEIEALNREFALLAKGAGGKGDIGARGIAQDIEKQRQSIEGYRKKLEELTEARSKLVGGKLHASYSGYTNEIKTLENQIAGAESRISHLQTQLANGGEAVLAGTGEATKGVKLELEAIQKLTTAIENLSTASNTLKTALESIKGSGSSFDTIIVKLDGLISRLNKANNEAFQLANQKNIGGTPVQSPNVQGGLQQNLFDPQKLVSFEEAIGRIITALNGLEHALALSKSKDEIDIIKKSFDEWNAKVKNLQDEYNQLQKKMAETATKTGEGKKPTEALKKYNIEQLDLELAKYRDHLNKLQEVYNQAALAGHQFAKDDPYKEKIESLQRFVAALEDAKKQEGLFNKKTGWRDVVDDKNNLLFGPKNKANFSEKVLNNTKKGLEDILNGQQRINESAEREATIRKAATFNDEKSFYERRAEVAQNYEQILLRIRELEASIGRGKALGADTSTSEGILASMKSLAAQAEVLKSLQWSSAFDPKNNPFVHGQVSSSMANMLGAMVPVQNAGDRTIIAQSIANQKQEELNALRLREAIVLHDQLIERVNKLKNSSEQTGENEKLKKSITDGERYITVLEKIIAAEGNWNGQQAWHMRREADMRTLLPNARDAIAGTKYDDKHLQSINDALIKYDKLEIKIKNLEALRDRGITAGIDVSGIEKAISQLKEVQTLSKSIADNGGFLEKNGRKTFAKDLLGGREVKGKENISSILSEYSKSLREAEGNMKQAEREASKLNATISNLQALEKNASALGIDTTKLQAVINDLKTYKQTLDTIAKDNHQNTKKFMGQEFFLETKRQMKDAAAETKKAMNAALKPGNEVAESYKYLASILRQITSLSKTAFKAERLGIDTDFLRYRIDTLKQLAGFVERNILNGVTTSYLRNDPVFTNQIPDAKMEQERINSLIAKKKQENAAQTARLTEEEQRLANAMKQSTDAARGQSQVLSDLKMMATQYLSVWGAQSFLNNIIEIGGQLEKQRLSIGAILGDVSHANDLFGKIKDLAIKSPFGVVELDQFTKQLSAYGFKYNELYDMTKRLADIAAGAGTDVSRLTLAIGHVRAEGALTGYTLRQFAMNNIPMVGELAKKLSEVENRVVTVADVRKRVSKKEIGYEDVIDVIKNLTNEGGMFYNMQEVISESIAARYKNLKDSLDIMYGEIAESGIGDMMKDFAVLLTNMSRQWKSFIPLIKSAAIGFAAYKATMLAVNMTMGKNTASVISNTIAYKNRRAIELQHESSVRKLTVLENQLIQTRNKLTLADVRVAMSTGAMTKADALKLVGLRKLSLEESKALIRMNLLSAAEIRMARNGRLLWMNLGQLGVRLKLFGHSLGASLGRVASSIFSTWNLAFAGMAVGMSAYQRMTDNDESKDEFLKSIRERANEGYKNMSEARKNFGVGKSAQMNSSDIKLSFDEMMDSLREYSLLYNIVFNNAFAVDEHGYAVHSLAEQYEILAQAIEDTANAQQAFGEMSDMVERAVNLDNGSNGFVKNFGDVMYGWLLKDDTKAAVGGLIKSLEYYVKTVKDVSISENILLRDHLNLRKAMDGRGLGDVMNMGNSELIKTLHTVRSNNPSLFSAIRSSLSTETSAALDEWVSFTNKMNYAFSNANLKMRRSGEDFYESMKVRYGDDMMKWPPEWKQVVMMAMESATKNVKGFSDMSIEYQNLVRDSFLQPFKITVDGSEAKEAVNNILVQLNNLIGKTWTVKIGIKGENSYEDAKKADEAYKNADEKVKDLEKRLERLGFKDGNIPAYADNFVVKDLVDEYNDAILERSNARTAVLEYGGDPDAVNKKDKDKKGSKSDKNAKELRERVRILKEAEQSYQYWRKAVGKYSAKGHVNSEFGKIIEELGYKFEDIEQYKDTLLKLRAEFEKKPKTKEMLEALKELDKVLADIGRKDFEENTEKYVSQMTREIDELTRKWEIFNEVRSDTGDEALAQRISGISPGATPADFKRANVIKFAGVSIDFDAVLGKSDEEIDRYVESLGVVEKKIKAVQNGLKDWKKAQQDLNKSDIVNYAKWLGSLVDVQSVRNRLQEEYNEALRETQRLLMNGDISQDEATRRERYAAVRQETEGKKNMDWYANLYNNANVMAKDEFTMAYNAELENLKDQLDAGVITLSDYAAKVNSLNRIASEFKLTGFLGIKGGVGAYLAGGTKGLSDYYKGRASKARNEGNEDEAEKWQKRADNLDKESRAAEQVVKAFQDLSNESSMLADMFNALGMNSSGDALGDAAGVLGGIAGGAQSLSAFGPWGAAAGAAIGGITSIAQLHDKQAERNIQALKQNVAALEANTKMLQKARERTLGYDNGTYMNTLAAMYGGGAAGNAMREYYGNGNSGSGYKQEYENLKRMREDYIAMYNEEEDKKNSSSEALEEYKQKIAELDDQIINFGEDLANSLWGIDIKGWASEIGDALMTAFENGENAAKAFNDAVKTIMQNVVSEMLKVGIIEPMMKKLRNKLFGYTDENGQLHNGVFDIDNPQQSMGAVVGALGEFFGADGEGTKMMEASKVFYDGANEALKRWGIGGGNGLANIDSTSVGNSIQSAATEESIGVLTGYIAAMRQDVSTKRLIMSTFVNETWPDFSLRFDAQKQVLDNTFMSVRSIEKMMHDGNGAMYDSMNRMSRRIDQAITPDGKMRAKIVD